MMEGEIELSLSDTPVNVLVSSPRRPIKTALHQAVLDERLHQVRLLVEKHDVDVDIRDMYGRSPLMLATLLDNTDVGGKMVKIFIRAGAFINLKDNENRTVLSYACMKGRLDLVKLYLKDEIIEIDQPDLDGNTPIAHAALCGNPTIVRILVKLYMKFSMTVDERNNLGYTPFLLACKYGHHVSAHILLTEGSASPALRDNEFYLNAKEWVKRSSALQTQSVTQRSRTAPAIIGFEREHSVYPQMVFTPVCCHYRKPRHPLGRSIESALRLPALFSRTLDCGSALEMELDGNNAQQVLLVEIDRKMRNPSRKRRRHARFASSTSSYDPPSTPTLLAVQNVPGNSGRVADINLLFKLYSEQWKGKDGSRLAQARPKTHPGTVTIRVTPENIKE